MLVAVALIRDRPAKTRVVKLNSLLRRVEQQFDVFLFEKSWWLEVRKIATRRVKA